MTPCQASLACYITHQPWTVTVMIGHCSYTGWFTKCTYIVLEAGSLMFVAQAVKSRTFLQRLWHLLLGSMRSLLTVASNNKTLQPVLLFASSCLQQNQALVPSSSTAYLLFCRSQHFILTGEEALPHIPAQGGAQDPLHHTPWGVRIQCCHKHWQGFQ